MRYAWFSKKRRPWEDGDDQQRYDGDVGVAVLDKTFTNGDTKVLLIADGFNKEHEEVVVELKRGLDARLSSHRALVSNLRSGIEQMNRLRAQIKSQRAYSKSLLQN